MPILYIVVELKPFPYISRGSGVFESKVNMLRIRQICLFNKDTFTIKQRIS